MEGRLLELLEERIRRSLGVTDQAQDRLSWTLAMCEAGMIVKAASVRVFAADW